MKKLFGGLIVGTLLSAVSAFAGDSCCAGKAAETAAISAATAAGSCCGSKAMQPVSVPVGASSCCGQKLATVSAEKPCAAEKACGTEKTCGAEKTCQSEKACAAEKSCGNGKMAKRQGARWARQQFRAGMKGATYLASL